MENNSNKIQLSDHFDYRKLLQFSLPMMGTMIISSIFGSVDDGFFITNFVGKDAFAAINLILPFIMMIPALSYMIGGGGSAVVSKTLGEGNTKLANRYFSMLIEALFLAGTTVSLLSIIFLHPILNMLGADKITMPYCVTYGTICLCFMPIFLLGQALQSFLTVAEKPKLVFWISLTVCVVNTLLDLILIYWLRLGVIGAAIATVSGELVGGVWPLIFFLQKNESPLHLHWTKIDLRTVINACGIGAADMVSNLALSIVNIFYNLQLLKYIGNDGVVAYGIIMYVSYIFSGVYLGYSVAVTPVIGYNYGADNKEELKNIYKRSLRLLSASAAILTGLAMIMARPLALIFASYDAELLELSVRALRLYCTSFIIAHINIFASAFFTGLNNGKIAAVISFSRTLVFQLICIYVLPAIFGVNGIWFSMLAAEIITLGISIYCLKSQKKVYGY